VTADSIFMGGPVLTVNGPMETAEAVAVRNGRIAAVGTQAEALALRGPATRIVDLGGATLMPGFVEPHSHPLSTGINRGDPVVDVRSVVAPDFDSVLRLIQRRASRAAPGEFLLFHGFDPLLHTGAVEPTRALLDALAPGHPVAVRMFAGGTCFLNTPALRQLGLEASRAEGVQIDEHGQPTGKLTGNAGVHAWHLVTKHRGEENVAEVFAAALQRHARAGYTTSSELRVPQEWLERLRAYGSTQQPPLRLVAYLVCPRAGDAFAPRGSGNDVMRVQGIKIFADGSPFAGNVWMSRPYLNTEVTIKGMGLPRDFAGEAFRSPGTLAAEVDAWAERGWQVAVHSQGDRSIDAVLDAFESAIRRHGLQDHRYRIEHCALPRRDQLERCARLGVTISFFLQHLWHWGEALQEGLFGAERMESYMPIGSAHRLGVPRVSVHSDSPACDPDGVVCMDLAANRRTFRGTSIGVSEALDVNEAIRAITINAAWQLFMDDKVGSIETGKYADFTLLDRHPQRVARADLRGLRVLGTWLGGEEVWRSA